MGYKNHEVGLLALISCVETTCFLLRKKFPFFPLLAIVGVALGVNVMIVVVAFMQGFQQKFRSDIIDAQDMPVLCHSKDNLSGERIVKKLHPSLKWKKVSAYMQGHLLLQNRDYHAVPFSMGIDPGQSDGVLPLNQFQKKGSFRFRGMTRGMLPDSDN